MNRRTVKLTPNNRAHAIQLLESAPVGYTVAIGEETRTQEQNALMWPLIQDMQAQSAEMAAFSADDVKLRFLNALGKEMRFLPELEGGGMFPVGQRSSTLTKAQFSGLLELMFAWGAENEIRWSARSENTRAEISGGQQ